MEMLQIGIILRDMEFAMDLARALARESRCFQFHVAEISGMDFYLTEEIFRDLDSERCVYLTRDEDLGRESSDHIYCYETSSQILLHLSAIYTSRTGKKLRPYALSKLKVVSVAAAMGGSGATAISLATAQLMHRIYGRRCLYMNASAVDDSVRYLPMCSKRNLFQLMLNLDRKESSSITEYIQGCGDVDRVMIHLMNPGMEEFQKERFSILVDSVSEMGIYDYFFFDLGNALMRSHLEVFQNADVALFIYRKAEENLLSVQGVRGELSRLRSDILGIGNYFTESNREDGCRDLMVRTSNDAFVPCQDHVELELHNAYGLDIMQIAQRIEKECSNEYGEPERKYQSQDASRGWLDAVRPGVRVAGLS